jgi:amino acid adenylation domain-containing protein
MEKSPLDSGIGVVLPFSKTSVHTTEVSCSSSSRDSSSDHADIEDDVNISANHGTSNSSHKSSSFEEESPRLASPLAATNEQDLDQIWAWNATVPPRINRCMHEYITACAHQNPNSPAVCAWNGSLTYAELEQASNNLAHRLLTLGVGAGTIVPVCFEKSRWTVVGVLGIMKTGAAIALMDPSQPLARLQAIVEQVNTHVIVTSIAQVALGRQLSSGATIVSVDSEILHNNAIDAIPLPIEVDASTPMYIQFTSGSTGKPKGVVISHASYTSGAIPRLGLVGYHAGSRCLDFPSYAFDVSIDCMMCTLAFSGCICVPSEEDRMNNLDGAIRGLKANMVHVTPSIARILQPEVMDSVEILGLGGEFVSPGDIANWGKTCQLAIAYGPSECTVGCTINNDVTIFNTGIGKGVGGVTWIVDPEDHEKLTPLGEIGELLIEGPIVGDGYLGEPEKTAEVFIRDPQFLVAGHNDIPGRRGRLYKTGDLVKYDPKRTGNIGFIGRKDSQYKLRGQRLELGEIEHHLRNKLPHSFTTAADVIKIEGKGEPTLMAFVAEGRESELIKSQDGHIISTSTGLSQVLQHIEQRLAEVVPRFMIPTFFVPLTKIPSLVSGKIDRKKLRDIGSQLSLVKLRQLRVSSLQSARPTTDNEAKICVAWRKVLSIQEEIQAEDTFFQLGGDSLRAMKLVAALGQEGLSLTVADILTHPTLSGMAEVVQDLGAAVETEDTKFSMLPSELIDHIQTEAAKLCGIQIAFIEDIYPCTPLQEGLLALSAKFESSYISQRVVDLPDFPTAKRFRDAFERCAAEACILRTRIVQVPGFGLLQIVVTGQMTYNYNNNLAEYLKEDQAISMELGMPLVRLAIIEDPTKSTIQLVLTMHHAVYDGWSMPLVIERINKLFHGLPTTQATPFKTFINYLSSSNRIDSEVFWKMSLEGATSPQFPTLPWEDYITKADSLVEHYVNLPRQTLSKTTIATAIRGAWTLVTSHYTGSHDVIFGETLLGRNAAIIGVETIEGPMITTVPIRTKVKQELPVSQFLLEIQDSSIQRIPHEHFGLQNIRRLSPDAREACDLRTGLVLNPRSDHKDKSTITTGPADGFAPANDTEAAREALKFNSYALMLVFTLDADGFLIMASFDSNCISSTRMRQVLQEFDYVMQQLCIGEGTVAVIRYLGVHDIDHGMPSDHNHVISKQEADQQIQLEDISPGRTMVEQLPYDEHTDENSMHGEAIISVKMSQEPSRLLGKETKFLELWIRLLQCEPTELHRESNFFDLGGDSILAMKLVSEARAENLRLNVAQIFQHRILYKLATIAQECLHEDDEAPTTTAFSLLHMGEDTNKFLAESIKPQLDDRTWEIVDVYPARPLQAIAVEGTTKLPRFSVRYELMHFDSEVDLIRLKESCQSLVSQNEVFKTVFVKVADQYFGVVLQDLTCAFTEHHIEGDVDAYTKCLCALDIQIIQPLGSVFVAFHFVAGEAGQSCLILKISHALYDETSFPQILHQLSALYERRSVSLGSPFSSFVKHVVEENIPRGINYWRDLLRGSSMSRLRPDIPVVKRAHFAIAKEFDITQRSKNTTIATLPTAAWAVCLAKKLGLRDVVFGEVVNGRNTDMPNCRSVIGPCWQYIPIRVRIGEDTTYGDILNVVQEQHVTSSQFEGISLSEIIEKCTDWPKNVSWFDTVVHQDVEHVESLLFKTTRCRMETIYPHQEPLQEIKLQVFLKGDTMAIEIVTFESWKYFAQELLGDIGDVLMNFVHNVGGTIGHWNAAALPNMR